ncbi:MAG: hypothetical protein ACT4PY_17795 [Armatimonadota bacterium]
MAGVGSVRLARSETASPRTAAAFDWVVIVLSAWLTLGAHLDAWAHINIPGLETFFTPWHAVLYSGYLSLAAFLTGSAIRNRAAGVPWGRVLPGGYLLSLLGVAIFAASGLGDMVWHQIFGIEDNLDALMSPTHLGLAVGAGLIVSGPLRAARVRGDTGGDLLGRLPYVLSLTFLITLLAYMTQWAHPFGFVWAYERLRPEDPRLVFPRQAMTVLSILLQSGILMGVLLPEVRRRALPAGSLTVVFGLSGVLMTLMRAKFLPTGPYLLIGVAALAGIVGDLLLWRLRPSEVRPTAFRVFAFAVPAMLSGVYFLALVLAGGIWWSVHLATGTVALAGIAGWLLSYLVLPPEPSSTASTPTSPSSS